MCGGFSESVTHSLWNCHKAGKVWKHTWLRSAVMKWKMQSFIDIVHIVAKAGTNKEVELSSLICWCIWKNINDVLHGKPGLETLQIMQRCVDWHLKFTKITTCTTMSYTLHQYIEEQLEVQVDDISCTVLSFDG